MTTDNNNAGNGTTHATENTGNALLMVMGLAVKPKPKAEKTASERKAETNFAENYGEVYDSRLTAGGLLKVANGKIVTATDGEVKRLDMWAIAYTMHAYILKIGHTIKGPFRTTDGNVNWLFKARNSKVKGSAETAISTDIYQKADKIPSELWNFYIKAVETITEKVELVDTAGNVGQVLKPWDIYPLTDGSYAVGFAKRGALKALKLPKKA